MKVYNRHRGDSPPGAIYVGRPTKWGNPFRIGQDGTREQVVHSYRNWITGWRAELLDVESLRGKDLSCWCAPLPCHADVLLEIANK